MSNGKDAKTIAEEIKARYRGQRTLTYDSQAEKLASGVMKRDLVPQDSMRAFPYGNEAKRLAAEIIYQYQQRQQPEPQVGLLPEEPEPTQPQFPTLPPESLAITPEVAEPSTTAMRTVTPTIRPPVSKPRVQPGIPEATPYRPGLRGKGTFPAFPDLGSLSGFTPAPLPEEITSVPEPSTIRKGLEVAKRAPFAFGMVSPERYEEIVGDLRERQQTEAATTQQREYWRNLYAGGKAGPLDAGLATYQAFWNGLTGSGMTEEAQYYPKHTIAGNIMGTLLGFYLAGGAPVPGAGKLLRLTKTPWVSRLVYNTTRSAKTLGLRDFVQSLGREVTKGEGPNAKKVFKETTDGVMWGIILGMAETAREPVKEFLTHKKVIEELPEFKRTIDKQYIQHLFTAEGAEEQTLIATTLGADKWKSAVKATRMGKEFEFVIPPRQVVTWMDRGYYAQLKKILGLERFTKTGTPTMKGEPSLKLTREPLATGFKKTIAVPKGTVFKPGEVVPGAKVIGEGAAAPAFGLTPETARVRPPSAKVIQEKLGLGVRPRVPERRAAKPPPTQAEIARAEREEAAGLFGPGRGRAGEQLGVGKAAPRELPDQISEIETEIMEKTAGRPLAISAVQSAAAGLSDKQYLEALKEIAPQAGTITSEQVKNIMAKHGKPAAPEAKLLSADVFPKEIAGGLEKDLKIDTSAEEPYSVAIANKSRLSKPESEQFRQKLEELSGIRWKVDEVSRFVFHANTEDLNKILKTPVAPKLGEKLLHGTAEPFQKFDAKFIGSGVGGNIQGSGVYLTDSPKAAEYFAKAAQQVKTGELGPGEILDVSLKPGVKVFDYTKDKIPYDKARQILLKYGLREDTIDSFGQEVTEPDRFTDLLRYNKAGKTEADIFRELGYDGIRFPEREFGAAIKKGDIVSFGKKEWGKTTVVFDPENIAVKAKPGPAPAQIEPIAAPTRPYIGPKAQAKVDKLRDLAKGLQKKIDEKLHPAIADQPLTARRARIAASMSADAENLRHIQGKLNAIAEGVENMTLPKTLRGITNKSQVEFLYKVAKYEHQYPKHRAGEQDWAKKQVDKDLKTLDRMGITNEPMFEQAKKDLMELKTELVPTESAKEGRIRHMEMELIGRKIPGFFPTPEPVARKMLEIADIEPGMTILEPSAGKGDLADIIKEVQPKATLSTVELNSKLREILGAKGHKIVGQDVFEHKGQYDVVVANPPFEKLQDVKHVRHYLNLVKPGGKLVTLMSEHAFFASDKQSVGFRDWLTKVGGTSEKLDPKSFTGKEAFRQTGVAARIVTIEKPVVSKEVVRPILTTSKWEDVESAIKRYQTKGIALRVQAETTPQGKRWKLYEKTPAELRAEAPSKKTVKIKVGRKTLDIPERRAPEVRAIRDKIEKMIDVRVEGYIREAISAPKAGRYPLADVEGIEVRGTREWTGQKSIRPEITKGISSAKLKDALKRKEKSALWREFRDVVRDELEYGGESFEGKSFPPDPQFAKLMADAKDLSRNAVLPARPGTKPLPEKMRGPILPETQKLEERIDKLERAIIELKAKRDRAIGMRALEEEGEDPAKITTEIIGKEKELDKLYEEATDMRSEHFRMGGPRPVPPEELPKNLQEKALRYGTHDPMTGLWRKDPFTKYVQLHAEQALKTEEGFSVVFIDVNGFKEINDTYGHLAGDKVIKAFGEILARNVKASDIATRWGGDEFGIFLPVPDKEAAKAVFQRIADIVDEKGLAGFKLSVSGGIAAFPTDGKTAAELISKADKAMYEAKTQFKADMAAKKKSNILDVTEAEASQLGELMGVKDIVDTPVQAQLEAIETEMQAELDLFEKQGNKYVMSLKKYFRIANKIRDGFWTFGPLRREFPGVYERSMEMYARFNAAAPNAASLMEDTLDKVRLDPRQRETALYAWEDKRLRPKLQKPLSEVVDKFDNLVQLYEKAKLKAGLLAELFPKSAILRNLDDISKIQAQPRITTKDRQKIAELQKENQDLKNIRWLTHRSVAAAVLKKKWAKLDPRGRRKFIGGLRQLSFRYRQRKGKLYLKDYVESELLKPQDVDIRRVFIDIVKDAEEKLALKETWDYAKGMTWNAEKGIKLITWKKEPPKGWVAAKKEILGFYAPEMEGAWMHPAVASMYEQMAAMTKPMPQPWGAIYGLFGKAKLMFFHKPGIILWYDNVPQRAFAGAYGLNPVRELRGFWTNLWKVWMKHPDYRRRRAMGLFSSPYLVGGKTMRDEVEIILNRTAKEFPRWKAVAERLIETPLTAREFTSLVGPVVHAHRMATWTVCDNPSRMQQVDRLMAMGHTEKEAIKIVSRASGAYAEPSPLFKKSLAPLFLVTNFRLLMPLEIVRAIAYNPTEAIIRTMMAKTGRGKPLPPHELRRRAKAFVATVAIPIVTHFYMKQRGWKVDKLGWKWYKTVKVQVNGKEVEKEVVIAMNNVINMPAKWLHRAMIYDPLGPPRPFQVIKNVFWWEIHPIWAATIDIIRNRGRFGAYEIYRQEDAPQVKLGKAALHFFNQVARVYPAVVGEIMHEDFLSGLSPTERKAQKAIFDQALNGFERALTFLGGYAYTRMPRAQLFDILDDKRVSALNRRESALENEAERKNWSNKELEQRTDRLYDVMGEGGVIDRYNHKRCEKPFK